MLHKLFILLSALVLIGCSAPTVYAPYSKKRQMGYKEKKIQPGIYEVTAILPKDVSARDADEYVLYRIAELCLAEKKNYFDNADTKPQSLKNDKVQYTQFGYCHEEKNKWAMGVRFKDVMGNLLIEEIKEADKSQLKIGNKVHKINGQKVATIGDIKTLIYPLTPDSKVVKVGITDLDGTQKIVTHPLVEIDTLWKADELIKALQNYFNHRP